MFVIVDQFVKWLVLDKFSDIVVMNYNGVFGILPAWVSFVAFVVLMLVMLRSKWFHPALVLVVSGGVSNLIDRVIYTGVIDFIAVWNFPVFNVADMLISVGAAWMIAHESGAIAFLKKRSTHE